MNSAGGPVDASAPRCVSVLFSEERGCLESASSGAELVRGKLRGDKLCEGMRFSGDCMQRSARCASSPLTAPCASDLGPAHSCSAGYDP